MQTPHNSSTPSASFIKKTISKICSKDFWRNNGYWWLVIPFLAIPFWEKGSSVLLSLTFIMAIVLVIGNYKTIFPSLLENRYLLIFLAFFIPGCISWIDTLNPDLTHKTLWRYVRYFGYGVLAFYLLQSPVAKQRFSTAMFWLITLYAIDAICQWLFEFNIYGHNPLSAGIADRVRGVFKYYHLSYFMATFSPLIFFYILQKIRNGSKFYLYTAPLFIFILCLTVFLGGARAGVVTLIVSLFFTVCYLFYHNLIPNRRIFLSVGFIILVITGITLSQMDIVAERFINNTVDADAPLYVFLNKITSSRMNIWTIVVHEIPNYWINGTGLRALDPVYQAYSDPSLIDMPFLYHAHLHFFEILIETGIIGLIPYLVVCFYLLYLFFAEEKVNPWLLVTFLAIMPINTHASLFERDWMPVVWVSIAIAMSYSPRNNHKNIQK